MKKIYVLLILLVCLSFQLSAKENIDPTVEPATFDSRTEITVTYDVTGTPLADLDKAYIWVWIPDASLNAKYNVNPASGNTDLTDKAQFTKNVEDDKTTFSITFVLQDFFSDPICVESQLGMLLKGNDWSDGQTTDFLADMTPLENCYVVKLMSPTRDPEFVDPGGTLSVKAEASKTSEFTLEANGMEIDQQTGITNYAFDYTIPESSGIIPVTLNATDGSNDTTINFSYLVNTPSEPLTRPVGVIPGINYDDSDDTKATVCLLAPGKKAVYLLGEFNDFEIDPTNKMYKDGDYFWIQVSGLTAGKEYAYQYLVDGVYVADPYSEKILDPDDQYIPENIYPNLKPYPEAGRHDEWYQNRLAIIQTGQSEFNWQNNNYQRPKKEDLVIYELLVRDFFAEEDRNYLNLIDTLSYLDRLGVNAIELMPVQEFAGNDSWGYNPTFMFAPDKAYGTEEALKKFVDAAHAKGISVILDVVFNHQDIPNPYVAMWFDYHNFKVTPDNPMFNVNAPHPYSVFYDLNHESPLTQFYMDTTLNYWINEYKVDGFRFDLSKGFTQNEGNNPGDVDAWGQYDQSRIDLIERMADKVWSYAPDTWLILEHFAENTEEKELADYGLMIWGNIHWDYKDLSLGVGKDISPAYYGNRDWSSPNLVSYMESHDEQRIMFEMLNYGQSSENYDVTNKSTALDRLKTLAAVFYTIPGPKMLWQFGELGYDLPINLCSDGTTIDDGCRTSAKPVKWEYYDEEDRKEVYKTIQALTELKKTYKVFETGIFSMTSGNSLIKQLKVRNKDDVSDPTNEDEMSVYVVANFDVESKTVEAQFPYTGSWYRYFKGGFEENVEDKRMSITLKPGEFRVYTNVNIPTPEYVTALDDEDLGKIFIYPNPSQNHFNVEIPDSSDGPVKILLYEITGRKLMERNKASTNGLTDLDIGHLSNGIYVLNVETNEAVFKTRIVKK